MTTLTLADRLAEVETLIPSLVLAEKAAVAKQLLRMARVENRAFYRGCRLSRAAIEKMEELLINNL